MQERNGAVVKVFDVFMGRSIPEVEYELSDRIEITYLHELVRVYKELEPQKFIESITNAVFKIIPPNYLPTLSFTYNQYGYLKEDFIDSTYLYSICHLDIISCAHIYFWNKSDSRSRSAHKRDIRTDNEREPSFYRNIKWFKGTDFYPLFELKIENNRHIVSDKFFDLINTILKSKKTFPPLNFPISLTKFKKFIETLYNENCKPISIIKDNIDDDINFELLYLSEQYLCLNEMLLICGDKRMLKTFFTQECDKHLFPYLAALPNIIGRRELLAKFAKIKELSIDGFTVYDAHFDNYYKYRTTSADPAWIRIVKYVCMVLIEQTFPIWEASVIIACDLYLTQKGLEYSKHSVFSTSLPKKDIKSLYNDSIASTYIRNAKDEVLQKLTEIWFKRFILSPKRFRKIKLLKVNRSKPFPFEKSKSIIQREQCIICYRSLFVNRDNATYYFPLLAHIFPISGKDSLKHIREISGFMPSALLSDTSQTQEETI